MNAMSLSQTLGGIERKARTNQEHKNRNTIATCNISNWTELNLKQVAPIENTK